MSDELPPWNPSPTPSPAPGPTPPLPATPHDEDTHILPPPSDAAPAAPSARRRTGVFSAALLAGALVVGGAGGVGGAALYDGMHNDSSATQPDISASKTVTSTPTSNTSSSSAIEDVASKVLPSVVQINVVGTNEAGSGSGIVLTSDGTILTNNHVVSLAGKSGQISVSFNDGTSAKASIVGTDPVTDLAVIKAAGVSGLTPAQLGSSSQLKVGQGVVAIGSPFGLGATVTSGIVSALDRPVSVQTSEEQQGIDPFGLQSPQQSGGNDQTTTYPAIQTDAAINPGNSGGPLANLAGQVVGINSSIRTDTSGSGQGGSIGLGFAIPMDEVLPIVNQLRHSETPTHARLGVSVSDNLTRNALQTGALVKSVDSGGAAAKAGLKAGDVVTKVDDELIDGSDALVATIRGHRPGDKVTLTVVRGSKKLSLQATLGSDANATSS